MHPDGIATGSLVTRVAVKGAVLVPYSSFFTCEVQTLSDPFDFADEFGPAKVIHVHEPSVGLRGILVIDNVAAGPAIGGLRMAEDASLEECFRLARAMSLKNAAAGLAHGGGKSVLIANGSASPTTLEFLDPDQRVRKLGENVTAEEVVAADVHIILDTSAWKQLAGIGDLVVKSRTSVMRYRDTILSVQAIAQELGVDGDRALTLRKVEDISHTRPPHQSGTARRDRSSGRLRALSGRRSLHQRETPR